MRFLAISIFALAMAGPAQAWEFEADEDPMTDKKTAVIVEAGDGLFAPALGAKCWEGGETLLIFNTNQPYDASASYLPMVPVKVRVDKNEIVPLIMIPQELSGRLVFADKADEDGGAVHEILLQIRNARQRVAVDLGSQVFQFSAKRSGKAVESFEKTCGLDLEKLAKASAGDATEEEVAKKPDGSR